MYRGMFYLFFVVVFLIVFFLANFGQSFLNHI
ncbi:hypothetical protein JOC74_000887 [Bacillus capparidis]|uniref:Uncharacterized protein n=1 Tax=Bacillus capparidis TaxID=1840411 RepID=A0ABS4CTF6_9BACI|nr:hypothetical protein [Bacillus capparidis]